MKFPCLLQGSRRLLPSNISVKKESRVMTMDPGRHESIRVANLTWGEDFGSPVRHPYALLMKGMTLRVNARVISRFAWLAKSSHKDGGEHGVGGC